MFGKKIRIERIIDRKSGKKVIIPMDHGTTMGPIKGLLDIKKAINDVVEGGANAILIHKGIVDAGHRGGGKDVGLIVHLSASTSMSPDPSAKTLVCSVEEAIKLGDVRVANMIACGIYAAKKKIFGRDILISVIEHMAKGHESIIPVNIKALDRGLSLAK